MQILVTTNMCDPYVIKCLNRLIKKYWLYKFMKDNDNEGMLERIE